MEHTLQSAAKSLVKQTAIRWGLESIALSRIARLWPSAGGRGVIFTLHHVRPEHGMESSDPNALLSITPKFLEEAILAAKRQGLVPVALDDLPKLLSDTADNRRFVSFTLDDGYRDNALYAAPVFRRHGVPYTIFITAGFVERTRTLWWETAGRLVTRSHRLQFDFGQGVEIVNLATPLQKHLAFDRLSRFVETIDEDEAVDRIDAVAQYHGIDPAAMVDELVMDGGELRRLAVDPLARFGAHTLTHANLRRVSEARLHEEIVGSAKAVESYVGRYPTSFAYPYGFRAAVDEREIRAVAEAGFTIAVTTQPGVLSSTDIQHPTAFHRVSLNGHFQKTRYVEALISGLPFKLR